MSFVTPLGQYEFLKIPFRIKTVPSRFQRYVSEVVVRELVDRGILKIWTIS